jgi:anti-sigma-K factor RskA
LNEHDGIRLMEYADGTLPPAERERVEAWLAVDAEARRVLAQHRALWGLLGESDPAPPVRESAEFRRRTVARAREQDAEPAFGGGWRSRATALAAAAVLIGVIGFAWQDAESRSALDDADVAVVGHLDLLERLPFLEQHAEALDLANGAVVLRAFPPASATTDAAGPGPAVPGAAPDAGAPR